MTNKLPHRPAIVPNWPISLEACAKAIIQSNDEASGRWNSTTKFWDLLIEWAKAAGVGGPITLNNTKAERENAVRWADEILLGLDCLYSDIMKFQETLKAYDIDYALEFDCRGVYVTTAGEKGISNWHVANTANLIPAITDPISFFSAQHLGRTWEYKSPLPRQCGLKMPLHNLATAIASADGYYSAKSTGTEGFWKEIDDFLFASNEIPIPEKSSKNRARWAEWAGSYFASLQYLYQDFLSITNRLRELSINYSFEIYMGRDRITLTAGCEGGKFTKMDCVNANGGSITMLNAFRTLTDTEQELEPRDVWVC